MMKLKRPFSGILCAILLWPNPVYALRAEHSDSQQVHAALEESLSAGVEEEPAELAAVPQRLPRELKTMVKEAGFPIRFLGGFDQTELFSEKTDTFIPGVQTLSHGVYRLAESTRYQVVPAGEDRFRFILTGNDPGAGLPADFTFTAPASWFEGHGTEPRSFSVEEAMGIIRRRFHGWGKRFLSTILLSDDIVLATPFPDGGSLLQSMAVRDISAAELGTVFLLQQFRRAAGSITGTEALTALLNHLRGSSEAEGRPAYEPLVGYINHLLTNRGNNPRQAAGGPALSGIQEIDDQKGIEIWSVKEGSVSLVFRVKVHLKDRPPIYLAVNVAKDTAESSRVMESAHAELQGYYQMDPRSVMEPLGQGFGVVRNSRGQEMKVGVLVGEWLEGFDELHVYSGSPLVHVWREQGGAISPLAPNESDQVWSEVARIQTRYSRLDLRARTLKMPNLRVNTGDFVGRRRPDGSWELVFIWVWPPRLGRAAAPEEIFVKAGFLLGAELGQDNGGRGEILWDQPEQALAAVETGLRENGLSDSEVLDLLRRLYGQFLPRLMTASIRGESEGNRLAAQGLAALWKAAPVVQKRILAMASAGLEEAEQRVQQVLAGGQTALPYPLALVAAQQQLADLAQQRPNRKYQGQGRLVDLRQLPPEVQEIWFVFDLHTALGHLRDILLDQGNLEKLQKGEAVLIIGGDAEHRENPAANGRDHYDSSVAIIQFILDLMILYPDRVYYALGNHAFLDDQLSIRTTLAGPAYHPWKYYRDRLQDLYKSDYLGHYEVDFLQQVPLGGIWEGGAFFHGGPPLGLTGLPEEILNQIRHVPNVLDLKDPIVDAIAWSRLDSSSGKRRYTQAEAAQFLNSIGQKDGILVVGHVHRQQDAPPVKMVYSGMNNGQAHYGIYHFSDRRFEFRIATSRTGLEERMPGWLKQIAPALEFAGKIADLRAAASLNRPAAVLFDSRLVPGKTGADQTALLAGLEERIRAAFSWPEDVPLRLGLREDKAGLEEAGFRTVEVLLQEGSPIRSLPESALPLVIQQAITAARPTFWIDPLFYAGMEELALPDVLDVLADLSA
ncbi:MAG: metallophosphoesterase [Candidatus Omnitrophica bacterium]|nr:metallophosphoesterase [Candidatus Omnitrophota bacterium]